ncbi:hypothetical protein XA68_18484 [Ophiocordyceps unilateralis]|uniref:Uncharacterized protein n=1 Tax=Ophiocordyceps unilateralis TaxID=268505 RepID=A0A2A9P3C9_OPHUN|nr:hypothetical protein XA68_18484 [Ophiocordyceps unilateralis]
MTDSGAVRPFAFFPFCFEQLYNKSPRRRPLFDSLFLFLLLLLLLLLFLLLALLLLALLLLDVGIVYYFSSASSSWASSTHRQLAARAIGLNALRPSSPPLSTQSSLLFLSAWTYIDSDTPRF